MAFNAAFDKPEEFSRVLSWIGSYTALQRSAAHPEGGSVRGPRRHELARLSPEKRRKVWATVTAPGRFGAVGTRPTAKQIREAIHEEESRELANGEGLRDPNLQED